MSAEGPSMPETAAERILVRVGTVLIVVGLLDIAYMFYFFASGGTSYASGFNIIAVVAGMLLRGGSLRVAQFVACFARFGFVSAVVCIAILPFMFPPKFIKVFFAVAPISTIIFWSILIVGSICIYYWVDRNLYSQTVIASMRDAGLHKKWPRLLPRLRILFPILALFGVALALFFANLEESEDSIKAISKAREKLGESYEYFVMSYDISTGSANRTVQVTVVAYSDSDIKIIELGWVDRTQDGD